MPKNFVSLTNRIVIFSKFIDTSFPFGFLCKKLIATVLFGFRVNRFDLNQSDTTDRLFSI